MRSVLKWLSVITKAVQRHNTFNTICLESIGTDFVVITLIILL